MAVQAQRAVVAKGEVLYPQAAVVQQGVAFAVDHPGAVAVDGQQGALGQQRCHVVARHAEADGHFGADLHALQGSPGYWLVVPWHGYQFAFPYLVQWQVEQICVKGLQRRRQGQVWR